jgi:hypothetical protein
MKPVVFYLEEIATMTAKTQQPLYQRNPVLRWIALGSWILIALAHLILFLFDLNSDFSQMLVPCAGADCNFLAISSAEVAVLTSWGLTTRAYALAMITVPVVVLLVYWALGGLILWRQGTSRLGLAVSLALIVIPITTYASDHDWSSNPNLAFLGLVVGILGALITLVFFYLIPNGRFSPRWAYIPLICTILLLSGVNMAENGIITLSARVLSLGNISLVSLALFGGGLQIYRYLRDSNAIERQQTKLILFGILSYVLAIIVWVLIFGGGLDIPAGKTRLLANFAGWYSGLVTILLLPAAITIAILRYRLWDIDLIIRKTLVYAVLTGLLVLGYVGMVLLLQSAFDVVSDQQSPAAIVISTLVIAALFAPLRQRVQDWIDRRFYRRKYDAAQTLAAFAATARDEVDLGELAAELVRVVRQTMQPAHVSLWFPQIPGKEKSMVNSVGSADSEQ